MICNWIPVSLFIYFWKKNTFSIFPFLFSFYYLFFSIQSLLFFWSTIPEFFIPLLPLCLQENIPPGLPTPWGLKSQVSWGLGTSPLNEARPSRPLLYMSDLALILIIYNGFLNTCIEQWWTSRGSLVRLSQRLEAPETLKEQ